MSGARGDGYRSFNVNNNNNNNGSFPNHGRYRSNTTLAHDPNDREGFDDGTFQANSIRRNTNTQPTSGTAAAAAAGRQSNSGGNGNGNNHDDAIYEDEEFNPNKYSYQDLFI